MGMNVCVERRLMYMQGMWRGESCRRAEGRRELRGEIREEGRREEGRRE